MRYGYINEEGYLRAFEVATQEEEAQYIRAGWKPVDDIDSDKLQCDIDHVVRVVPFDSGDHISFNYEVVVDVKKIRDEIEYYKKRLSDTDYQVIKCYEASLVGEELPYDVKQLHLRRQNLRDLINALSEELESASSSLA